MNELKDAFARLAQDEPPLRTTKTDIMRSGRSRQRRQNVLAAVGGLAVAGLVVGAVIELPSVTGGGAAQGVTAAAGQPSASDTSVPSVKPTDDSTPATDAIPTKDSAPNQSWPENVPGLAEVKAARTAKLLAIASDVKSQIAAAGYGVGAFGVDDSMGALLAAKGASGALTPAGIYAGKFSVSKGGKQDGLVIIAGDAVTAADVPTTCAAGLVACSTRQLPGGATEQLSDVTDAGIGATGRQVTVWNGTVTHVRFVSEAGGLTLPDDLLVALATSPVFDLSGIAPLTAAQRTVVDAAIAQAQASVPMVKPTTNDATGFESKMAEDARTRASMDAAKSAMAATASAKG